MSSINPHYTFNYSQPEDYRFSHDSVFLARRVFELIKGQEITNINGLDLCSGCGIIGLDFLFHCQKELNQLPASFDFLEVQDIYQKHFEINAQHLMDVAMQIRFVNENYNVLQNADFSNRYDLILCNPPYFFPDKGTLSPSQFKNRCRFFIDSDFKSLLLGIWNSLTTQGNAYVLLRDLSEHGWSSAQEAHKILEKRAKVEVLGDIRGTHFVKINRLE